MWCVPPRDWTERRSQRRENLVIQCGDLAPPTPKPVELLELTDTQSAKHVRQAIVPAKLLHLVIPRIGRTDFEGFVVIDELCRVSCDPVGAKPPHAFSQLFFSGN